MPLLEEVVTLNGVDNENSLIDLFCNPIVNIFDPSALKTTALGFESLTLVFCVLLGELPAVLISYGVDKSYSSTLSPLQPKIYILEPSLLNCKSVGQLSPETTDFSWENDTPLVIKNAVVRLYSCTLSVLSLNKNILVPLLLKAIPVNPPSNGSNSPLLIAVDTS